MNSDKLINKIIKKLENYIKFSQELKDVKLEYAYTTLLQEIKEMKGE